jgi:transcriptional regulator with XRE-family HTH domain
MTASEFKEWRVAMGWSPQQAAEQLGVQRRTITYYEQGVTSSGAAQEHVPKSIALAALALKFGRDIATAATEEVK